MSKPMKATIAEGTEYITKADLEAALDAFYGRVDARLNEFREEIRKATDTHIQAEAQTIKTQLNQEIISSQADSIAQMEGLLDKRVEDEAKQRRQDISTVQEQVTSALNQMSEVNQKLTPMISQVDRIVGKLDGWSKTMESNQRLYDENKHDIEDQEKKLDDTIREFNTMKSDQTILRERQDALHRAIHGDSNHDGPESIYSALEKANTGISDLKTLLSQNANRLTEIEKEQSAQKEKWAKRWESVKSFTTNRYFLGTMIILAIILAVTIRPENQNFFTQGLDAILQFFKGN